MHTAPGFSMVIRQLVNVILLSYQFCHKESVSFELIHSQSQVAMMNDEGGVRGCECGIFKMKN